MHVVLVDTNRMKICFIQTKYSTQFEYGCLYYRTITVRIGSWNDKQYTEVVTQWNTEFLKQIRDDYIKIY